MSKLKLIEAIRAEIAEEYKHKVDDFSDSDLKDWLYDIVEYNHVDHSEVEKVAKIGNRFFQYNTHLDDFYIEDVTEVEPYEEKVIKYRKIK